MQVPPNSLAIDLQNFSVVNIESIHSFKEASATDAFPSGWPDNYCTNQNCRGLIWPPPLRFLKNLWHYLNNHTLPHSFGQWRFAKTLRLRDSTYHLQFLIRQRTVSSPSMMWARVHSMFCVLVPPSDATANGSLRLGAQDQ